MSKNDKQRALVPRLRFPEFRHTSGWAKEKLGAIITLEYGSPLPEKDRTGDGFPVVGSNGVVGYHRTATVSGPTIVVGRKGSVGQINLIKDDCTPIDTTFYAVPKRPSQDHFCFIWRLLESSRLDTFGDAGAVPGLNRNDVHARPTAIPEFAEQKKIADCLGSLDDLISAEGRKLAALRDHKKGLMQQLFPREGETRPRLQFPEFRNAGEWGTFAIGEFADIKMCKRILASQTNDREGVPFYKIGTLGGKPDAYIPRKLYEEYRERFSFPKKGEVLITCSGTVGKCIPYDGEDAYYQDSNIVWIANSQREVSNQFLHSVLLNVDWSRLNSTTITRIYMDDLRALKIVVPPKKAEQNRIADCLSSLDDLIAAQAEKLDALRTHKHGLMQQLFPSPEDVEV